MTTSSSDRTGSGAAKLSTGLGWFSLGLGSVALLVPGRVNQAVGVRDDARSRLLQRGVGVQELAAAAGIFAGRRPIAVLWGRAAADVVHLCLLARAGRTRGGDATRRVGAMAAVGGAFAADSCAAVSRSRDRGATRGGQPMRGTASITVHAPRDELARRWSAFAQDGSGTSRLGPVAISREQAGSLVEWRTTARSGARARGTTRFLAAPGDRGTEVHVAVEFEPPLGALGAAVQKLTGDDAQQRLRDDLRRFKQLVETGEIARSDGAPTGHSAKLQPKQRPAQPVEQLSA
jgi:hypothetical protein